MMLVSHKKYLRASTACYGDGFNFYFHLAITRSSRSAHNKQTNKQTVYICLAEVQLQNTVLHFQRWR
jgi:hypothetical protein